jgi:hypothetical protein
MIFGGFLGHPVVGLTFLPYVGNQDCIPILEAKDKSEMVYDLIAGVPRITLSLSIYILQFRILIQVGKVVKRTKPTSPN